MTAPLTLTKALIRQLASEESFERGSRYYSQGAVVRLTRRGDQFQAEVEGSSHLPYQVTFALTAAGISGESCTCPYDWGGACKHIVAALLACLEAPDEIEEHPPLASLLTTLDRDQLQTLLLDLAERRPDLSGMIEARVLALQAGATATATGPAPARPRQTPLDAETYRRQVRAALHSLERMRPSEAYWHAGSVVDDVRRVMDQARPFIEAGDGRSALVILEAVTDEYVAGWWEVDGSDGDTGELFPDLGALWTEAILTADLTPAEREGWAQRLADWAKDAGEYGIDEAFDAAEAAAIQGWDDPDLQRVLRGERTGDDNREEVDRWYAAELTRARLAVLARQGRHDEYLNLAAAEGQTTAYATMLVRLGRTAEAVTYGLAHLATTDEALALAQALLEHGDTAGALRVAEHGLTVQGYRTRLARWLRDVATSAGETDRALAAARAAVRESADLTDYQAAQELAGERWPAVRDDILAHLRRASTVPHAGVEILLAEGLIDEAIARADAAPYDYTLVEQVANAALPARPDWVLRVCRAQAERIMDEGKSKYYHHAAQWLTKARAAALATGRDAEWRAYMEVLLTRHGRKYNLVPLLQPLR